MTTETTETVVPTTVPEAITPEVATAPPIVPEIPDSAPAHPDTPLTPDPVVHEPWYLADGVLGTGPRPEYLDTKYTNMQEQAKAYTELQAKFGAHAGAPEEYNLDFLKESPLPVDVMDPQLVEFLKEAKENNVSQVYVEKAVLSHLNTLKAAIPNPEEEFKKLGPDGEQQLNVLRQWAVNNLNAEETQDLLNFCVNARRINLWQKIRGGTQPTVVPGQAAGINVPKVMSVQQLQKELGIPENYDKYNKNGNYRKEWDERFQIAMAVETNNRSL